MSDARVPMLDADAALAAAERAGVVAQLAELNVFRVLLTRERVAKGTADLLLSLLFGGALDARLRELVIMRIGWATGSVYEWTQHWRIALDLGATEDDLLGVRQWREHAAFGDTERAVLQATDQCIGGDRIDDETWRTIEAALGVAAATELVCVIGAYLMVSTVLRSLDVPLEDGVQPWPPDGVHP